MMIINNKIRCTLVMLFLIPLALMGQKKEKEKAEKKINFAVVPVLDYSHATGFGVGALGQMYYKVSETDTISPVSSTGIFGLYTTNGTWFGAAFQRLYLNEDRWRILAALGAGTINYQYFQEIPIFGGAFIGFNTKADFALLKVERKIVGKLYFGILGVYANSKTVFDLPDFIPPDLATDRRNMNSLGYTISFDKRDNQISAYSGYNISFRNNFYGNWIGSDNKFESFDFNYNHYFPIVPERQIIAYRLHAAISTGDVPFQGQHVVGQNDIRGYSDGRYRDNMVYAAQAEYRHRFKGRFGAVAFFGVATAIESFSNFDKAPFLPGGGVGVRYMAIEKERINIGLDVGMGKDDWGIYFRIGESF